FLVPGYENLLACAAELDERTFNCSFNSALNPRTTARETRDYLKQFGAEAAQRRYAEKYNCPIVAYNLAESVGLDGDVDEVERTFLLCFKIRPPTAAGEWRLPEMTDDPRNIPYLAPGYERALKKFRQSSEQVTSEAKQSQLKSKIEGVAFEMLIYVIAAG